MLLSQQYPYLLANNTGFWHCHIPIDMTFEFQHKRKQLRNSVCKVVWKEIGSYLKTCKLLLPVKLFGFAMITLTHSHKKVKKGHLC